MKSYTEWEYERDNLYLLKSESINKLKEKSRRNWDISRKVSKEYLSDNENQRRKSTETEQNRGNIDKMNEKEVWNE